MSLSFVSIHRGLLFSKSLQREFCTERSIGHQLFSVLMIIIESAILISRRDYHLPTAGCVDSERSGLGSSHPQTKNKMNGKLTPREFKCLHQNKD